jgi:predicted permease
MAKRILSFFRNLLRKRALDQALDDELRSSVEVLTQEKMKQGLSQSVARREALMELGGIEQVKEEVRAVRAGRILEDFARDARFAFRTLAKSPGFTTVAVLTLALGIGANTAIFSVVNGVLLNPLPYPHPNQLVEVAEHDPPFNESSISYPNFLDWVQQNHSFQSLAAYRQNDFSLTGQGEGQRVKAMQVSATFFSLLDVKPVIGRDFTASEDKRGATPTVMLSENLWKHKFGGSRDILGKMITLDGTGYTVVGVVPANFYFCCESTNFHLGDVYTPIGAWNNKFFYQRDNHMAVYAVGRLKTGITFAQAQADMNNVAHNLARAYPNADSRAGIFLAPLKDRWVRDVKPILLLLLAAVGFVLLIACVNVANLLLARSTGRAREFAIRVALGASQGRVIRQLLTESTLLAIAGGALGLLLAWWGRSVALSALPHALPRTNSVSMDGRVLLFTLAVCILVGVLFGLAPTLNTLGPDSQETLKEGGRGASGVKYRTQGVFVVIEMGLAVVLLIGAGLTVRSLVEVWNVNPGFNTHKVLGFDVAFPLAMAKETPEQLCASLIQLRDTIGAVPGAEAVSSEDGAVPFNGDDEISFWVEGQPKPALQSQMDTALFYLVSSDYLKVMQIPLLRGRFFTEQDDAHAPHVGVIDENFAKKYFPTANPIGKIIKLPGFRDDDPIQIVGVVGHVTQWGLDTPGPVKIALYVPVLQLPDMSEKIAGFVVRTQTSQYASASAIQNAVEKMNSQMIPFNFESMDRVISESLASRRFAMFLLAAFGAVALVLSSIGIYGVISYVAGQRTHEIGIRMALGGQRRDVLKLVLGHGMRLALVGIVVGVLAALGLTRFLSALLYGVKPTDPLTFIASALTLTGVALLACYIPARRATKVDPIVALRYE